MRLSLPGIFAVAIIALTAFLPWHQAAASTRIFWHCVPPLAEEGFLAARTMDLNKDDLPTILAMPAGQSRTGGVSVNPAAWTSRYGSVVIRQRGLANFCVEGINTAGLAFHFLYMTDSQYQTRDSRPGVDGAIYGQYLLDNAPNVAEALALMDQTQLAPGWMGTSYPCHLALEDAKGDSAVVEFVGGKMVVYRGSEYTVLANEPPLDQQLANLKNYRDFGGQLPWPGYVDSKSRFVKASAFYKTLGDDPNWLLPGSIAFLYSAISAAATPFGAIIFQDNESEVETWPTLWTSLYDLGNKVIYFSHTLARNQFTIDMSKIKLSPGHAVLYLKADRADLFGKVSKMLRPVTLPGLPLLLLPE